MSNSWERVPIELQSVNASLSRAAVFLVLTIGADAEAMDRVRGVIADISGLARVVGFRDVGGRLTCNVGLGSSAWDRLRWPKRPAQNCEALQRSAGRYTAVATRGDLLFHIWAEQADMCFELDRLVLEALGDAVTVANEVQGFRYFEARDLLGFVDGTENPTGNALPLSSLIRSDDPDLEGSSNVVVQKYVHKHAAWNALQTSLQESIIGRTELNNPKVQYDRILDFSTATTVTTFFVPSSAVFRRFGD